MHREKIVRKVGTIEGFEEQPLSTCLLSLSALSRRNAEAMLEYLRLCLLFVLFEIM